MKQLICIALALCLAAGVCGCGQGEKEATSATETTVVTTTEVATTEKIAHSGRDSVTIETEHGPIEDVIKKRIHDSLPEFEFTLLGYGTHYINRFTNGKEYEFISAEIHAIEIRCDEFYQRLDGIEAKIGIPSEDDGIKFADYNGDGFLDIRLIVDSSINRQQPSFFWLWDNSEHKFVRNKQLEEFSGNGPEGLFTGEYFRYFGVADDGRACGSHKWDSNYYEYIDGVFVLMERVDTFYQNEYEEHTTYKRINGKMKLVSGTKIWEEEDGTYLIEEYKAVNGELKLVSSTRKAERP